MFEIITAVTTNLFRTFIIYKFLNVFFPKKKEGIRGIKAAYGLFFLVTAGMNFVFTSLSINIVSNLVMLYLLTWFYVGEQRKKILVTILIYGINFICDVLAVFFLSDYKAGEAYNAIAPYVTVFLIGICEHIVERYIVKKRGNSITPPHWNILMLIPGISLIVLYSMVSFNLNNRIVMISVSAGILLINLLVFYLYDTLIESYGRLQDQVFFERQIASYSRQLDILMKSEERLTMLRHDIKHHFNELYAMAKQNRGEEIAEYISQMQMFLENEDEYSESGNRDIDSLLNYLLNKAQKVLKKVDYQINIPQELEIRTFDLNAILGNLLENAIYASKASEEKLLKIEINYDRGILFVRVQNSYNGRLDKRGEVFLSTKSDREEHGIGLQSVRRVVDTYQGIMEINYDEKIFEVRLILYI